MKYGLARQEEIFYSEYQLNYVIFTFISRNTPAL